MSTNDCPGANPVNNDELKMGCWAEHADGSLILVESTEGGNIVYSMFDMAKTPPVEYRDMMAEIPFKKAFSWDPKKKDTIIDDTKKVPMEKWIWKDKTPFDFSKIIKKGVTEGVKFPSAHDHLSSAERVAESLKLKASDIDEDDHRFEKFREAVKPIKKALKKAMRALADI